MEGSNNCDEDNIGISYEIEDIRDGSTTPFRASRLRLYHDKILDTKEELDGHFVHTEQWYGVQKLVDVRYSDDYKFHEAKVQWKGF